MYQTIPSGVYARIANLFKGLASVSHAWIVSKAPVDGPPAVRDS